MSTKNHNSKILNLLSIIIIILASCSGEKNPDPTTENDNTSPIIQIGESNQPQLSNLTQTGFYWPTGTIPSSKFDNWFKDRDENFKITFKHSLLNYVKLIVNKIESDNEEKVFGNLNSKRIPLDGADLVRAILITRVANEESRKAGDIKNIVRVNERRVRIGWELDEINTWWSLEEVKGYFKTFIVNKSKGDIIFNPENYPINNLLLVGISVYNRDFKQTIKFLIKSLLSKFGLLKQQLWGYQRTLDEHLDCFKKAGFQNVQYGRLENNVYWIRAKNE